MEISKIIDRCIAIIEKEITTIEAMQQTESLDRLQCEKLVDYVKTLVTINKEQRIEKEDQPEFKSNKELEDAILVEAEKIKESRGKPTRSD